MSLLKSSAAVIKPGMVPNAEVYPREGMVARTRLEEWAAPMLVFISIIPILISFFFINAGLRLDESQSLWQVSRSVRGVLMIVAGDVHVPLYHLMLHYWLLLFGNSVPIARLLSLSFFVLSIPALYLLGKKAYSSNVGLVAAFLFSISPFMNWYGNEIRMYTVFVFFTILNQYFFLKIFKDSDMRATTWSLYTLTAVLGVFSHYFFFLNLVAQAIFYGFRGRLFPEGSLVRLTSVGLLVGALFAPWAWFVISRGVAGFQQPLLVHPSTVDLFNTFSQFLFGFQQDVINTGFLSLWPLAAIAALIGLGRTKQISLETEYLVVTLIIAFGATFIGSYLVTPMYISRYLIFTIPALYLLLINIFDSYKRSVRLLAEGTLIALMLITLGVEMVSASVPVKEQYASAAEFLTDHATAQDVVLLSAPFTIYPVQYYYRGLAPLTTLPNWNQYAYGPIPPFNASTLPAQVASTTRNYQNAYLLLSYDQGYEEAIRQYFDSHYQRISSQAFSNDLTLYVYRLRYNTSQSAISASL